MSNKCHYMHITFTLNANIAWTLINPWHYFFHPKTQFAISQNIFFGGGLVPYLLQYHVRNGIKIASRTTSMLQPTNIQNNVYTNIEKNSPDDFIFKCHFD